jgi:PAS domain S-box-containing protein
MMNRDATPTGSISFMKSQDLCVSDLGKYIQEFDWGRTSLGPIADWSQSLFTSVQIALGATSPALVCWGSERIAIYNDAFANLLAEQHPHSLGRPVGSIPSEFLASVMARIDGMLVRSESFWRETSRVSMTNRGTVRDLSFSISWNAIKNPAGTVEGYFVAFTDETEKVLRQQRTRTLNALTENLKSSVTLEDVNQHLTAILVQNARELPFTLLYHIGGDGHHVRLIASTGIERGTSSSPTLVDIHGDSPWPFRDALESIEPILVTRQFAAKFIEGDISWPANVEKCWVIPIAKPIGDRVMGFFVTGICYGHPFDDGYQSFLKNIASLIAMSLENIRTGNVERLRGDSLDQLNKAKTTFFANVSHEFRTPLTLMLGPIEELLTCSTATISTTAKNQLEMVNRNGVRLMRLVNALLDFSRIDAGRVQATYEPTNLAEFTENIASLFRSTIENAGLQFKVSTTGIDQTVFVDRDMWEKIVLNLISNAFKFTFQGEIEVSMRLLPAKSTSPTSIELSVRDTGVGIPEHELPHLFERFHRIPTSEGRSHEGCGVGLALVQELVWLHSGAVRVESKWRRGSTFFVTVPLGYAHLPIEAIAQPRALATSTTIAAPILEEAMQWTEATQEDSLDNRETPSGDGSSSVATRQDTRSRILIVDDNLDMRRYLTLLLNDQYLIETAPDGKVALELTKTFHPDLILSDVMMPHLDGFGMVRLLRQDQDRKEVPIILVSALPAEESRLEGIEAGADDYLIKPFSARELVARVQSHLERSKKNREIAAALRESEKRYRLLFEGMLDSVTFCRVIRNDEGEAIDWVFIDANPAFQKLVGFQDVEGKRASEIFPNIQQTNPEFWHAYCRVASTGKAQEIEGYFSPIGKWTKVSIISPLKDHFISIAEDISERKLAEIAVRESEERYRSLFDGSPIPVWEEDFSLVGRRLEELRSQGITDFDSYFKENFDELKRLATMVRILNVNNASSALAGAPRETLLKTNLTDYFETSKSWDIFRDELVALAAGKQTFSSDFHVGSLSGGPRFVSLHVAVAPGFEKSLGRVLASFIDLTKQKKVEQDLRLSEEQLRFALEAGGLSSWTWNPLTNEASHNEVGLSLFGISPEDWTGDTNLIFQAIHPEDLPNVQRALAESIQNQSPYHSEFRVVHKNGEVRWLSGYGRMDFDENGVPKAMYGINMDITDRKRSDEQLRINEERLRLALKSAKQGLWDLNVQTGVAVVSPEYATMLGYSPETFSETNQFWIDRLHPDDREHTAKVYQDYVAGRLPDYSVEFRQQTASGEWKWILSSGRMISFDAEGKPLRMIGTHTDISMLKEAQSAIGRSEHWFQMLFEQAAIGVVKIDAGSRKVSKANKKFCEMMGIPEAEVCLKTVSELFQSARSDLILNGAIGKSRDEIVEQSFIQDLIRGDGSSLRVRVDFLRDEVSSSDNRSFLIAVTETTS